MNTIRIGSRESKLAVIQSELVMDAIRAAHPGLRLELVTMKTTGDRILDRTLDQIGGKGLFVKELDVEKNRVVLAKAEELFSQEVIARDINLISVESIPAPLRVKARVRYRQKEQPATVLQTGPDELRVVFDQPQRAVTPGQSLVLYDGDTVVGGGKIARK